MCINFVRSGLQSTPNNAKVHYNFANLQADAGNVVLAGKHYRTAIQSGIAFIVVIITVGQ